MNDSGESCSSVKKAKNNCRRLQYNSVVTSKLFFEWDKMMTDLILTFTLCIPPTR